MDPVCSLFTSRPDDGSVLLYLTGRPVKHIHIHGLVREENGLCTGLTREEGKLAFSAPFFP